MNKIITTLLNLILNSLVGIVSYIVPKDDTLILTGSHIAFIGNTKYFYLYLNINKTPFKAYWITRNKSIYKQLQERNLPVVFLYSLDGLIKILRAKYLLVSHGPIDVSYSYMLPGRFKIVQLWHGLQFKKIGVEDIKNQRLLYHIHRRLEHINERSYHLITITSEIVKDAVISAFENKNVKVLGYPRNDVFFDERLRVEKYDKVLELNKYNKIILYAPTFRDHLSPYRPFSEQFLNDFNRFLVDSNYLFLIKKHPYDKQLDIKSYSNIRDVSAIVSDIQELLIYTDILITDYSSVVFDFVLLDRPIIFYPYDLEWYVSENREFNFDYYELPGPFAYNERELFEIIKSIDSIFNNNEYKIRYKAFKDKFNYYQDGNSSKRLLEYLTHSNIHFNMNI